MSDLIDQILGKVSGDVDPFKKILGKIPGFSGYVERQSRRDSDKLLRETVASRFEEINKTKFLVLQITDNGIGIDEQVRQQLFKPFFTTKAGAEKRGLGLCICKDIVNGWGGFISVSSAVGAGSTFSVHLPV